jgi:hypothetical protein
MKGEYSKSTFWTVSLLTSSEGKAERSTVCTVTKTATVIRFLNLKAIRRPRRELGQDTETGSFVGRCCWLVATLSRLFIYTFTFMFTTAHSQLTCHSQYNHNHLRSILISCIPWPMSLTLDFSPSSPSPIPCVTC